MLKNAVKKHKTLNTGLIIAVVGAAQIGLPQIQAFVPPLWYGLATFLLGVLVAGIGAWNTMKENAAREAALTAEQASEEAGA